MVTAERVGEQVQKLPEPLHMMPQEAGRIA